MTFSAARQSLSGPKTSIRKPRAAFTGEVSVEMLVGLCSYVIVGHSERRTLFRETDDLIGRKVKAVKEGGLRPILCVGERLGEREEGIAEAVVERQVDLGLARIGRAGGVVVAYEPVWAIGTGRAATPEDAQSMMAHVRSVVARRFGDSASTATPISTAAASMPTTLLASSARPTWTELS